MKKLLLNFFLFLVPILGMAQISSEQAANHAAAFLQKKYLRSSDGRHHAPFKKPAMSAKLVNDGVYAVNLETGGFVLVPNSEKTTDILGYSDEGGFDMGELPDNVRAWLQGYADQVGWNDEAETPMRREQVVVAKSAISPMLTAKWDQGEVNETGNVFNWQCPTYHYSNINKDYHCYTGCVAVAMAQVMYYYHYPSTTTAVIPSFTSNSSIGELPELPVTAFAWEDMQDEYTGSDLTDLSTSKAAAIGKLLKYCGYGSQMNYGTGGSSTSTLKMLQALVSYFGYDMKAKRRLRSDYSRQEWESMVYDELKNKRPVLYGGASTGGGHQFVVDGYDGDGMYHVNWGWGGYYNGYFLLDVLNPESSSGAGSSSTPDGYTMNQDAVFNLQPSTGNEAEKELTLFGASCDDTNLYFKVYNKTLLDLSSYLGVAALDAAENMTMLMSYVNLISIPAEHGLDNMEIPRNYLQLNLLEDGAYHLTLACKLDGSSEWQLPVGYEKYYLEVTVKNHKIESMTPSITTASHLIVKSVRLTGGISGGAQEIAVEFQNTGDGEFGSSVLMFLGNETGLTSSAGVFVPAQSTSTAYFYFKPTASGTYTLNFWKGLYYDSQNYTKQEEIGSASVTYTVPDITGPVVTFALDGVKDVGGQHYTTMGTTSGMVTLTNTTSSAIQNVNMKLEPFAGSWELKTTIEPGSSLNLALPSNTLSPGNQYTWILTDGSDHELGRYVFTYANGLFFYKGDGSVDYQSLSSNVTVPADVTSVDLRLADMSAVTSMRVNNPNTLLYANGGQTLPSGLNGNNIVIDGSAASVSLSYGYDFCAFEPFTAQQISFTRSFKGSDMGSGGWSTIVLPFTATSVQQDGNTLDWFHSGSDTGKQFWLYRFVEERDGKVVFSYASEDSIQQNTPYIIAVPDDTWGPEWNLGDKDLVFSAQNVKVNTTEKATISGDDYKMVGTFHAVTPGLGYQLNNEGDRFVMMGTDSQVAAFDAYFLDLSSTSPASFAILLADDTLTGVPALTGGNQTVKSGWYTLQGIRIATPSQPGIYLYNSKKILVK